MSPLQYLAVNSLNVFQLYVDSFDRCHDVYLSALWQLCKLDFYCAA